MQIASSKTLVDHFIAGPAPSDENKHAKPTPHFSQHAGQMHWVFADDLIDLRESVFQMTIDQPVIFLAF